MRLPERLVLLFVVVLIFSGFFFEGFARVDVARMVAFLLCAVAGIWGVWQMALLRPEEKALLAPFFKMLAFFLFFILMHLAFLAPLPRGLVQTISPAWDKVIETSEASKVELPAYLPLAIAATQAKRSLHAVIAATCLFIAAGMLSRKPRNAKVLLVAVGVFSVLEGWTGVVTHLLLGVDRARGAVFNPDHHAAAVMIGFPIAVVFVMGIRQYRIGRDEQAGKDLQMLLIALLSVSLLGWLFSHSRAGLITGLMMGLIWLVWEARVIPNQARSYRRLETGAAVALAVLLPLMLAGTTVIERYTSRFNALGEGLVGRLVLWQAALKGLAESRFLGMGPGGTEFAINRFLTDVAARKIPIWAHNDYVQFVCDFGVPASIIAGALLFWAVSSAVRPVIHRSKRAPSRTAYERAALIGLGTILAHSVLDFPLRVPLLSFLLIVLCAYLCTMEARRARRRDGQRRPVTTRYEQRRAAVVSG